MKLSYNKEDLQWQPKIIPQTQNKVGPYSVKAVKTEGEDLGEFQLGNVFESTCTPNLQINKVVQILVLWEYLNL